MPERMSGPPIGRHAGRDPVAIDDDATLHAIGYPRKLTGRFRAVDNFAMSFTVINILS
ncbi:hypothetical protein GCM10022207_53140 [Streptomyces lannensis]|uniref:Transposase n=1 Tax=Streptomyces lannensis TaxID=766498 RepID=A0ABP7KJF2_9ACTN